MFNYQSTDFIINGFAMAENSGTAVVSRRSLDDKEQNRPHYQSFRDLRQFLTVTADQIGVVAGAEDEATATTGGTTGYINSAFAMSSGGGTPSNCTISNDAGVTVIDVDFPWIYGLNFGTTVGDLEIIVDGSVLPRLVAGTGQDSWYEEDLIVTGRIRLWDDVIASVTPISIEVRRKFGTVDTSETNTARIQTQAGIVLGTPAQVALGVADYGTWADAITACPVGGKITVLQGFKPNEAVSVNKRLTIVGGGYDTGTLGTFTFTTAADFATVRGIHVSQFIFNSGAAGVQAVSSFWDVPPTDANPVGTNRLTGIWTV